MAVIGHGADDGGDHRVVRVKSVVGALVVELREEGGVDVALRGHPYVCMLWRGPSLSNIHPALDANPGEHLKAGDGTMML